MSELDMAPLGVLILVLAIQVYAGVLRLLAIMTTAIDEVIPQERGAHPPSILVHHFLTRWLFLTKLRGEIREGPASTGKKIPGAYYLGEIKAIYPQRLFSLAPVDQKLVPAICNQFSLFALAAMGIVRFAYGEPILRLV